MGLGILDYCLTESMEQKDEIREILTRNGINCVTMFNHNSDIKYLYAGTNSDGTICISDVGEYILSITSCVQYTPLQFMRKALDNPNWDWPNQHFTSTSKKFTDYGKIKLHFP